MLTTQEMADRIGVSRQRVLQLRKEGTLKAKRFGAVWQFYPNQNHKASSVGAPRGKRK